MIYSQVVWALAIDRIVWHVDLNVWTMLGVGSIICSLALVSLTKEVTIYAQDGAQYETILTYTDIGIGGNEMDSLYTVEGDTEGIIADC